MLTKMKDLDWLIVLKVFDAAQSSRGMTRRCCTDYLFDPHAPDGGVECRLLTTGPPIVPFKANAAHRHHIPK